MAWHSTAIPPSLSVYSQESSFILFYHKGQCISYFLVNGVLHADSVLSSFLDPKHLFLWTLIIFLNFSPYSSLHSLMHGSTHLTKPRTLTIYLLNYSIIIPSCPCTFSFKEPKWLFHISHFSDTRLRLIVFQTGLFCFCLSFFFILDKNALPLPLTKIKQF